MASASIGTERAVVNNPFPNNAAESMAAPPLAAAVIPLQPVHIYPKAALELLQLKCPTMRGYCSDSSMHIGGALQSGLNRTLATFEGGPEEAYRVCSSAPDFERSRFDAELRMGRVPGTPHYTCVQARTDGSTACPMGGCPLPTGKVAEAPLELLTWDCQVKEVGPLILARSIVASEYRNSIVSVREKPYVYGDGIYREVTAEEIMQKAVPHLGSMATIKQMKEIAVTLCISLTHRLPALKPSANHICFRNGSLNVQTRLLEPPSPAHMLLNRIDHSYDRAATCPRFVNFLDETFAGDTDKAQKIAMLRQWFGYIFTADSSHQKMLLMQGEGANGKSILEALMERMLGRINVHGAMLHRFKQAHVRSELEGKLLNISADLPKTNSVADGEMKAIVSGDAIEVSPKFKPSYTIEPYCRLVVATNHPPSSKDTSEGYFRRLIILKFNNIVPAERRNPNLLAVLVEEMPGIIAWAIEGLYDLREKGQFTIPLSSQQEVRAYRDDMAPVRMFAEECLTPSPDRTGFSARDLYMAFRAWCRDHGLDPGNVITMGRELATMGFISRKSGTILWMVKATDLGQEYFRPAHVLAEAETAIPSPAPAPEQQAA
jgi:putative DNA primase/helicase